MEGRPPYVDRAAYEAYTGAAAVGLSLGDDGGIWGTDGSRLVRVDPVTLGHETFDAPEVLAMIGLALAFAGLPVLLPSLKRWTVAEWSYAGFAAMGLLLSRLNYVVIWWGYARSLLPLAVLSVVVAARATGWIRWGFLAIALAFAGVGVVMLPRWVAGLAVALAAIAMYSSWSARTAS